jgi:DNA-binding transcriptional LysR family regulator
MILNERVLKVVITLADELHFGNAAETLHVSQPALSGTIKNVEDHLGVRLFSRTSRSVNLTDAGKIFVTEARRLIREGERVVGLVRDTADVEGPLLVGYAPTISLPWLCRLIARARNQGLRAADLHFTSAENSECDQGLRAGTFHAAFITRSLVEGDLQSMPLGRKALTVVLPAGNPLASCKEIPLGLLRNQPVIWMKRALNPALHESLMTECAEQGYHPNVVQEVKTFHECVEFAARGVGVTFLPAAFMAECRLKPVVFRRLLGSPLHMENALVYRRADRFPLAERFLALVREHAASADRSGLPMESKK